MDVIKYSQLRKLNYYIIIMDEHFTDNLKGYLLMDKKKSKFILPITGTILLLFGLVTLFLSNFIFFGLFGLREVMGNYVLFVVIANFFCSILYLFASYGMFKNKRWTTQILIYTLLILVLTFIALMIYIVSGGLYEMKTIVAMTFRTLLTTAFLLISYTFISKKRLETL